MRQDADVIFLIDASSSVVNLKFKGCGAFTTPINEFTDRIIERFDQNGYFTNKDDGMHVAAVTYKNIANIGFSFQKNADTIKQALRDLDLDGKVAATYAHRGFEVIGENLLNSSKYGFRGFNRVPVVIVVISDGKSHFEDVVGSDGSRNLLQDALNHPNINNDKVYRVALEIFDTENKYLYNQMASSPSDVLRLHCDVGGVAAQQGANLIGPALPGNLEDLISATIVNAAADKIFEHITSLSECHPPTTVTSTSTSSTTRTATTSVSSSSTSTSTSSTTDACHPYADVVFVIDESTSIVDDEFCDGRTAGTFDTLTAFAAQAVGALAAEIDDGWVRVGAVVFSTGSKTSFGLRSGVSATRIVSELTGLQPPPKFDRFGLLRETTSNMHLGLQEAQKVILDGDAGGHPERAQHIVVLSDFIPRNKKNAPACPTGLSKDNFYKYENCIMGKGVAALKAELQNNSFYALPQVSRWAYDVGCVSTINTRANTVSKEVLPMVSPSAGQRGFVVDVDGPDGLARGVVRDGRSARRRQRPPRLRSLAQPRPRQARPRRPPPPASTITSTTTSATIDDNHDHDYVNHHNQYNHNDHDHD